MSRDGDESHGTISKQITEVQQIQTIFFKKKIPISLLTGLGVPDVRSLAVVMGSTPQ